MANSKNFFPLLTSPIWDKHKQYYEQQGETAWNYVPFLYTSNKFMACWIADIIMNLSQTHPDKKIQIIELGSGHGMFSYFLYHRLQSLNVDFSLTVTDLIQANLDYLSALPQWQGLQVNWLQMSQLEELKTISGFDGVNFVIANYFFDSLPNDGYELVGDDWQKAYLLTKNKKNQSEGFVDIDLSFISKPCQLLDEDEKLLNRYKGIADHVLIPTAVKDIMHIFHESTNPSYFFVNDKGFLDINQMNYGDNYAYNCDGAMSTMVNFDAIKYWAEDFFDGFLIANDNDHDGSHFMIFSINSLGQQQQNLVKMALSGASWNMIFKLFMVFEEQPEMSFDDVSFYVQSSRYDEAMLSRISGYVFNQIKEEGSLINQLKPMLNKIMETFYWHPARMMYYFTMIDLFTLCGEYQKSQNLINQYKHLVHSQYDILLREGVILYKMQQHDLAIEKFNKALKINSKCQESRRYLELLA